MAEVGRVIMDGRTVLITVDDDNGNVRAEFPFWRSPIDDKAFAVTYSPGTSVSFVDAQVRAALAGEVPPFVGI